jgi:hypothetical protein
VVTAASPIFVVYQPNLRSRPNVPFGTGWLAAAGINRSISVLIILFYNQADIKVLSV